MSRRKARVVTQSDFRRAWKACVSDIDKDIRQLRVYEEGARAKCGFNQDCHNGRFNPAHRCDVCPHRAG